MIPVIGIMVGAYIVTRMTAMLTRPDTNKIVKALSIVTIAIALLSCLELFTSGVAMSAGGPLLSTRSKSGIRRPADEAVGGPCSCGQVVSERRLGASKVQLAEA